MATILIVEDDSLVAHLASEILGRAGHEVRSVRNADEALGILREAHPKFALALVDLVMPGIDGAQLLAMCRFEFPGLRVILTSGYSEAFVRDRTQFVEPDAFLAKPWHPNDLVETAKRLLGNRGPLMPSGVGA